MITLSSVSKIYQGAAAVDDISFEVQEGENLVLLGTSGCGKTTTLRMINRLIEPTAGEITVNGSDITLQEPEKLRQGIGYVLQHNGLFPHYTIRENIGIVPSLLNWDSRKTENRVNELLDKLHLPPNHYANLYPSQLSGGQQQRVGLARALAADPPILLMDEPFGALDPVTRGSIRKEFSELEEFKKKTIVLVTHDVQEAFELGDRICLMDKGRIVQLGTPVELLFSPASPFVVSFLNNNRLTLELQAITLNDVFEMLPGAGASPDGVTMDRHLSLWQAMELLSNNNHGSTNGYVIKGSKQMVFDIAGLTAGYAQFKSTINERN